MLSVVVSIGAIERLRHHAVWFCNQDLGSALPSSARRLFGHSTDGQRVQKHGLGFVRELLLRKQISEKPANHSVGGCAVCLRNPFGNAPPLLTLRKLLWLIGCGELWRIGWRSGRAQVFVAHSSQQPLHEKAAWSVRQCWHLMMLFCWLGLTRLWQGVMRRACRLRVRRRLLRSECNVQLFCSQTPVGILELPITCGGSTLEPNAWLTTMRWRSFCAINRKSLVFASSPVARSAKRFATMLFSMSLKKPRHPAATPSPLPFPFGPPRCQGDTLRQTAQWHVGGNVCRCNETRGCAAAVRAHIRKLPLRNCA